jgi:hypothetical protein
VERRRQRQMCIRDRSRITKLSLLDQNNISN